MLLIRKKQFDFFKKNGKVYLLTKVHKNFYMKKKEKVEYKLLDGQQKYYKEFYEYLKDIFLKAQKKNGLEYIYTLLRVGGMKDGGWDPFVEAEETLNDFSKILRRTNKDKISKRSFRFGLLIYCHAIEMSAPYQILYNILCCIQGKNYNPFPFPGRKRSNKNPFDTIPKFPKQKIKILEEESEKAEEQELIKKINSFFDENIRNAFYHSGYTLTDSEFRICESGIAYSITYQELSEKLAKCFAFYEAFFNIYKQMRLALRKAKKFHRLQNFEVFELLSNAKEGLIGFKMHFSNGSHAHFERRKERVQTINIFFEKDGINFFVGDLGKLQPKWMVNDKQFREINSRYNSSCTWKPIQFYGKTGEIIKEIKAITDDPDVQGCLFYIKCTGHEAIEFVIKSNRRLFNKDNLTSGKIEISSCGQGPEGSYIYDGTYFVNSLKVGEIKIGLNRIKKLIKNLERKNTKIIFNLKYTLEQKLQAPKRRNGNTFTIVLSMDDPRNTLCVSHLGMLPKTDWRIKENWIE